MAPDWSSMESWRRSQQQSIQIESVISKLQISKKRYEPWSIL